MVIAAFMCLAVILALKNRPLSLKHSDHISASFIFLIHAQKCDIWKENLDCMVAVTQA